MNFSTKIITYGCHDQFNFISCKISGQDDKATNWQQSYTILSPYPNNPSTCQYTNPLLQKPANISYLSKLTAGITKQDRRTLLSRYWLHAWYSPDNRRYHINATRIRYAQWFTWLSFRWYTFNFWFKMTFWLHHKNHNIFLPDTRWMQYIIITLKKNRSIESQHQDERKTPFPTCSNTTAYFISNRFQIQILGWQIVDSST